MTGLEPATSLPTSDIFLRRMPSGIMSCLLNVLSPTKLHGTLPLSRASDFMRHYVQQRGVSSRHRREGVSAHPVYLNLFSPFLDGGVACNLRHWHQLRPIIATIVAPGCIGWNIPTSVPVLVCPTCQRTFSFHVVEVEGFEPTSSQIKSLVHRASLPNLQIKCLS